MDARVKPAHDSECVARPECDGGPGKWGTASHEVIAGLDPAIHDAVPNVCLPTNKPGMTRTRNCPVPGRIDTPVRAHTLNVVPRGAPRGLRKTL